jgi:hypothetical protein
LLFSMHTFPFPHSKKTDPQFSTSSQNKDSRTQPLGQPRD